MLLKSLLPSDQLNNIAQEYQDYDITSIECDSRNIKDNTLFIAIRGVQQDGANFITDAVSRGSKVIVCNQDVNVLGVSDAVCLIKVKDTKQFMRECARKFYGNPSGDLTCFGVTGTNGKTTTTYLLESILVCAGYKTGVVGTVTHRVGNKVIPSKNTTPGYLENQRLLCELQKEKITHCVMEVSSHALDQNRVDDIAFDVAIFSNLSSDHLDYHQTIENYFAAKKRLFTTLKKSATAIINIDDPFGQQLKEQVSVDVLTYGITNDADVRATDVVLSLEGTQFCVNYPDGMVRVQSSLIGIHNVYNILAAMTACISQKYDIQTILEGVENLHTVPGRLEKIECHQGYSIFIDYAHTEDALRNVLNILRQTSNSKLILVFGCGGNRDKTKRPKMGAVAAELADFTIVTSDNPRSENPETIIDEIIKGFTDDSQYVRIADRRQAIEKAISIASSSDIILLAGKGHEQYQVFKDKIIEFNEKEIICEFLNADV